jgi:5'-3' exoribonuclease 2
MGVPAFFRWLRDKYPKCIEDVIEEEVITTNGVQIPINICAPNPNNIEFDNLYLDMNGIIHPCVHPEDVPAPETEEDMFIAIFHYIDRIVAAVRPRNLLFMAIDGVAPRAKMNQQRSRRFKAAQDMAEEEEVENELRARLASKGQPVPPKKKSSFDHNVITPGTRFMDRLSTFLQYYVTLRVNEHPGWRNLKVILSDASVPGEGEHKIMEFIRQQRACPGYNPNIRHVLHGLDADLIMLGLSTHEPYFTILREDVLGKAASKCYVCGKTGHKADQCVGFAPPKKQDLIEEAMAAAGASSEGDIISKTVISSKPLQFLHISTLREYLLIEFHYLRAPQYLPFGFDLERLIDDFVFLCFFVGNDFLPHLPSMDIREGAIDLLLAIYKDILPSLGGYMTDAGTVNLSCVDILLSKVGIIEDEIFKRRRAKDERDKRYEAQKKENQLAISQAASKASEERTPRSESPGPLKVEEVDAPDSLPTSLMEEVALDTPNSLDASTKQSQAALKEGIEAIANRAKADIVKDEVRFVQTAGTIKVEESETIETESLNRGVSSASIQVIEGVKELKSLKVSTLVGQKRTREDDFESAELPLLATAVVEAVATSDQSPHGESANVPQDDDVPDERLIEALDEGLLEEEVSSSVTEMLKASVLKALLSKRTREQVEDNIQFGTAGWKERYYRAKLGDDLGSNASYRRSMFKAYTEGLCWVFKYYYQGVASWTWFYPFHYAPFASDLRNLDAYEVKFELGEPFRPLDQLMSVLPPRSAHALPQACSKLMTDPESPIADFYPTKFGMDPNGKKFTWQWVVLLPFVDEKRLVAAVNTCIDSFTEEEKRRNTLGAELLFVHKESGVGRALLPIGPRDLGPVEAPRSIPLMPDTGGLDGKGLSGKCAGFELNGGKRRVRVAPIEGTYKSPWDPILLSINHNQCILVSFSLPLRRVHSCRLLSGARIPPQILGPEDTDIRTPRLTRGLNIADLANMVISRPRPQYGEYNQQQQQQHYYYQQQQPQQSFQYHQQQQNAQMMNQPFFGMQVPMMQQQQQYNYHMQQYYQPQQFNQSQGSYQPQQFNQSQGFYQSQQQPLQYNVPMNSGYASYGPPQVPLVPLPVGSHQAMSNQMHYGYQTSVYSSHQAQNQHPHPTQRRQ